MAKVKENKIEKQSQIKTKVAQILEQNILY